MSISSLPAAPEVTDTPTQFNSKAFAWVASLDTFVTQTNALAVDVNAKQIAAANSASSSSNSANNSALSASQSETFKNQAEGFSISASSSAAAAQAAAGLPGLIGKNGFVLTVNDDASGVDFRPIQTFGSAELFVLGM
jgi:hypothetical protein